LNVAVNHLPKDWENVAWIDADVTFDDPDWVDTTIRALKYHPVVQMFRTAIDLGPTGEAQYEHTGFFAMLEKFRFNNPNKELKTQMTWHSGYAWACRRDFYNAVGGFVDWGILGAGDRHMAAAMIGRVEDSLYPKMDENNFYYTMLCKLWQSRAQRFFQEVKQYPTYVPMMLTHYYHGSKKNRQYGTRWKILVDHKFNPIHHLKRDCQGVYQLCCRDKELVAKLIKYFVDRCEDSTDETVPPVIPPIIPPINLPPIEFPPPVLDPEPPCVNS
jgi:hypothetical protein